MSTTHPSYDEIVRRGDLLPTYEKRVVPPEHQDFNGHMNIAHYMTASSWAIQHALWDWGVPRDWVETDRLGTFTAEHHLTYLSEVHVGTEISVRVRAVARSAKALHAQAFLLDDTERRLSYTMELMSVHVDLATRRTATWPGWLAERLDGVIAEHATLDWPTSGCLAVR